MEFGHYYIAGQERVIELNAKSRQHFQPFVYAWRHESGETGQKTVLCRSRQDFDLILMKWNLAAATMPGGWRYEEVKDGR